MYINILLELSFYSNALFVNRKLIIKFINKLKAGREIKKAKQKSSVTQVRTEGRKEKLDVFFFVKRSFILEEKELTDCTACSAPCISSKHLLKHSGVVST